MYYNITYIASQTNFLTQIQAVNTILLQGLMGLLILIAVGFICYTSFLLVTGDNGKAMASTSFILFGLSIFLYALGLISSLVFFVVLALCAAAIALTKM